MKLYLLFVWLAAEGYAYDDHRWFQLRRTGTTQPLHKAAVACAFHNAAECESLAGAALTAGQTSKERCAARDLLEEYLYRLGRFRELAGQLEAGMGECGPGHDTMNQLAMVRAWATQPNISVVRLSQTRIHTLGKNGFIGLQLDGKPHGAFVDTGANVSVISVSAARRLGLKTLDSTGARFGDITGRGIDVRQVAVAKSLRLGDIELANVPFVVLPDEAPPFRHWSRGKRCILGIQVLLACRTLRWSGRMPRAVLELAGPGLPAGEPNMVFEGMTPVVEAVIAGRSVELVLDTGAASHLGPRFAKDFPDAVSASTGPSRLEGVGGSASIPSKPLKPTPIRVGGLDMTIGGTPVYLEGGPSRAYGLLGNDILFKTPVLSIDFTTMRFSLLP